MWLPNTEIRYARFFPSVMYVRTLVSRQYPASCLYNSTICPPHRFHFWAAEKG
jgi:hypothetical protein